MGHPTYACMLVNPSSQDFDTWRNTIYRRDNQMVTGRPFLLLRQEWRGSKDFQLYSALSHLNPTTG
jgi:hypothetical protein